MKKLVLIAIITLICSSAFANKDLDTLKSIYKKEMEKIEEKYKENIENSQAVHLKDLEANKKIAQRQADLPRYKRIDAEIERFKKNKQIPKDSVAMKFVKQSEQEKLTQIADLSKKYFAGLKNLQKKLMMNEDISGAEEVQKILKSVDFVVADIESKDPVNMLMKGLVLHYDFDRNEGKKVTDKSGSGNDGSVHGATWKSFSGGRKGVMEFDGKRSFIMLLNNNGLLSGEGGFTLSTWLRTTQATRALLIQQRSGGEGQFVLSLETGYPCYYDYRASKYGIHNVTSSERVNDGSWHKVDFVRNGNQGSIYIDGFKKASITGSVESINKDLVFAIGYSVRDRNLYYDGEIDDVMIWSRALSENEVKQVYKLTGGK